MRLPILANLALAVAVTTPTVALAQTNDDARFAQARARFEQAEADYGAHRYRSAAEGYLEAYSMMDGHRNQHLVLFNAGQALAEAGDYDAAIARFRQYLREGGDRVENRGEVEARVAELEALRGRSAPGDDGLLVASIVTLGLGGVGLASMGIFGGLALAEHDSLAEGCGASMTCTRDDIAASDDLALVADISLGIGLAALTAGVVMLIISLATGDAGESAFQLDRGRRFAAAAGVVRW